MQEYINVIASCLKDYRNADNLNLDDSHVKKWINQFDLSTRLPMLRELSHTIGCGYLSYARLRDALLRIINWQALYGVDIRIFWRNAILLDIQQKGYSQSEILKEFTAILYQKYAIIPIINSLSGSVFVYLDDFLFHGSRISSDLQWWLPRAPDNIFIFIILIGAYNYGLYKTRIKIQKMIENSGKNIRFIIESLYKLENRQAYKDQADIYWPTAIAQNPLIQNLLKDDKYPFIPRTPNSYRGTWFNNEADRQILENQLLQAGLYIYSLPQNENKYLRPLGFSGFGLGFGSTIVTYRNCPNNAPLALWWGSLDQRDAYPLSAWYPLFPRKTY